MENLIDKSYFWGDIEITGLFKPEMEAKLDMMIAKYQKEYLKQMFGTYFLEHEMTDTFKELLIDDELKTSPIANFVYFYWQRNNATFQTNAGVKTLNVQNTQTVSPAEKMVSAWNQMVTWNEEIHNSLYEFETDEFDYLNDIYPYIDESILTYQNQFLI